MLFSSAKKISSFFIEFLTLLFFAIFIIPFPLYLVQHFILYICNIKIFQVMKSSQALTIILNTQILLKLHNCLVFKPCNGKISKYYNTFKNIDNDKNNIYCKKNILHYQK